MDYFGHWIVVLAITAIPALGLSLFVGRLDLLCMCQAAFAGVGAYVSAYLTTRAVDLVWLGIVTAVLIGASVGWLFGWATASLSRERLVLATLGFQLLFSAVVVNCTDLTNGPEGIRGIPELSESGLIVIAAATILVMVLVGYVRRTPLGRLGEVLRDSERFVVANGIDACKIKRYYFTIGAGIASLGGALFAHRATYIDPVSFSLNESVFLISAVLVGGGRRVLGVILGVAIITSVPESLRFLGMGSAVADHVRQVLYGFVLLGVLAIGPSGEVHDA